MTPESKSEEILINVTPQETRVAVVEDGVLQEIWVERHRIHGLVGNVYKGRVCRVMPGMDAAFVDIGLEKSAFLHASDVSIVDGEEVLTEENGTEPITKLLHQDQNILVQVIKDPIGSKGARLTTHITVPSRHLVLMPYSKNIGISSRIVDENDRQSLRQLLERLSGELGDGYGYIVRTVAETASEHAIRRDMTYLRKLWGLVVQSTEDVKPGSLVYEDLPLALRTLRDLVGDDVERVRIDSSRIVRKAMEFAASYVPHIIDRIEHYARARPRPIFDIYGIEDEIQKALERKVQLKSGGYLIIDQTEALTTCDVNTGAFLGHRNLEETIFKTNLEAAQSIARQLRLRNLGGDHYHRFY